MIHQASIVIVALFAYSASALAFHSFPVATTGANVYQSLLIPKPTPAPIHGGLRRREDAQKTLLAGPDATCGYLGGNSARPWGCTADSSCAFATATVGTASTNQTTTAAGSVLCCDSKTGCPTAPGPTACADNNSVNVTKECTGACLHDDRVLKCTSGIYVYCNTIAFATPSLSAFYCDYLSSNNSISAVTAFAGQASHAFTPVVQVITSSTTSSPSSTLPSKTASSTSHTPTAAPKPAGKKDHKAAIIGGVVGGVAGLALIAAAVFLIFFIRRRRAQGEPEPVPEEAAGAEGKGPASVSEDGIPNPASNSKAEGKKVAT